MSVIADGRAAGAVTPALVLEAVAGSFSLTPEDLRGRRRDRAAAQARQVAMYLLKEATPCSLAQIGLEMGNRDHSTVIHACRKVAVDLENDPQLKRRVAEIRQGLTSR
jgi:chromosomal replication initiator protein